MEKNLLERYARQMLLPEIGKSGQEKIMSTKVLVAGAGGLGCPALTSLVTMGIGTVGIADFDVISFDNLPRQHIYYPEDVSYFKTNVAIKRLQAYQSGTQFIPHQIRISNQNVMSLIAAYDYIIDATDNFETRYLLNDACVIANKPLVFGAVFRFESQVSVFNFPDSNGVKVNYRHLYPTMPKQAGIVTCDTAGVSGIHTAITGNMMASEVLKLIIGIEPLANQLLTYDMLTGRSTILSIAQHNTLGKDIPIDLETLMNTNYAAWCQTNNAPEIDWSTTLHGINSGQFVLIDIRLPHEQPELIGFPHIKHPGLKLEDFDPYRFLDQTTVICCATGKRSQALVQQLIQKNPETRVFSLINGAVGIGQSTQIRS